MTSSRLHPPAVVRAIDHASGSLKGYAHASLLEMCARLGEPSPTPADKAPVHWAFLCADGTQFSVYSWKEQPPTTGSYWWCIGGTDRAIEAFHRHSGLPVWTGVARFVSTPLDT